MALLAVGTVAFMLTSLWFSIGPSHVAFPLCVALASVGFPIFIGPGLARKIPGRAIRIRKVWLRGFHFVGVLWFDRLLSFIGWNSLIQRMRNPLESPADLERLSLDLRAATAGHACGLLIHAVPALFALATGHVVASLWILLPAVPLHSYPFMLQLVNLERLSVLVDLRAR